MVFLVLLRRDGKANTLASRGWGMVPRFRPLSKASENIIYPVGDKLGDTVWSVRSVEKQARAIKLAFK